MSDLVKNLEDRFSQNEAQLQLDKATASDTKVPRLDLQRLCFVKKNMISPINLILIYSEFPLFGW